jgi:AcrR family transcriptional regulator
MTVAAPSRREEILAAALAAFTEKGFAAATIEDVRARSGASTGSIYHHFGGKEGLAAAIYVEGLRDFQQGFLRELRRDRTPEETIKGLVRYHLRWIARNAELARFIFNRHETEVRAQTEEPMAQLNRRLFAEGGALLEPLFESGELRPLPLELFNAVLVGPSQEFARHWLAGRTRTPIKTAERELAETAWAALRGEGLVAAASG